MSRAALAYLQRSKQEHFLSPSKKVLLAGAKTVSDMGSLGETLKDCVSLYSDEYTLKMDLSMNEGDISMEGRSSNEQKQIKGNLNISGAPSIDFFSRHWCGQCAGGSPDNQ